MIPRSNPTLIVATALAILFCWSASCLAQAETAQPAQAPGAITGRVVNSAGDPLFGAVVFANSVGSTRRSQSARADNNGDFKLDGLPAGVYRVSASVSGYAAAVQVGYNAQNFYRPGDYVTLTLHKGGVITGKVTGANGPLIAAGVFAVRVRDETGKRLPSALLMRERATDDRGVYRLYGLPPGSYLVFTAKPRIGTIVPSAFDNDMPTYFPSSPRDTASEITIREGDEIAADIQYRAEPGHAISGQVSGIVERQEFVNAAVNLVDVRNRSLVSSAGVNSFTNFGFAFTGVPDGEYELIAFQFLQSRDEVRSAPRRVTVRASDVSGLNLTMAKQATIEGRLVFEADARNACGKRRETAALETIVQGRRYEPEKKTEAAPADVSIIATNFMTIDAGDPAGRFVLRNLPAGTYGIDARAPASGWYLRAIAAGQRGASLRTAVPTANDVTVRAGETVSGLTVTFTEGAAAVRGSVTSPENQRLPDRTFVYLIPAEKEAVANVLRYFETPVAGDGSFVIGNVAPGDYFIVALRLENETPATFEIRGDSNRRNAVVREAVKSKQAVTLKPCQRLDDFEVPYSSSTKP